MKTSIKEVESKYFTDDQKGVTVCIISGYTDILGHCENFEVKGISRCHEDDKYNEVYGRRLAESRAKLKMFKLAEQRAGALHLKLTRLTNEVKLIKEANRNCQAVETKHLSILGV